MTNEKSGSGDMPEIRTFEVCWGKLYDPEDKDCYDRCGLRDACEVAKAKVDRILNELRQELFEAGDIRFPSKLESHREVVQEEAVDTEIVDAVDTAELPPDDFDDIPSGELVEPPPADNGEMAELDDDLSDLDSAFEDDNVAVDSDAETMTVATTDASIDTGDLDDLDEPEPEPEPPKKEAKPKQAKREPKPKKESKKKEETSPLPEVIYDKTDFQDVEDDDIWAHVEDEEDDFSDLDEHMETPHGNSREARGDS
jgi:hypothetical protein